MNSSEAKKLQAAKHTPGPWRISGVGKERLIFRATDTSVYPVATVELDSLRRFGSGDLDATAALIAAAPEMLEMLYKLNDMIEGGSCEIEALIKKAGGTFE